MSAPVTIDVVGFLGREFMAYIGSIEESAVDAALANPGHPDHARLVRAASQCGPLLQEHWPHFVPELVRVPPGEELSRANVLRREAGGAIPDIPSDEGLLGPLARIARDVFPVCLLDPQSDPMSGLRQPGHRLVGGLEHHPAAQAVLDQLAADPLADLFATDPPPAFFSFSSGTGSAVSPEGLPLGLIGSAAARARLAEEAFTFEALLDQLRALIKDLRTIQAGADIELPTVVALHGVSVQPGLHVNLPWGLLRAMDADAQKAVGDAFVPVGAIFVTSIPCAAEVSSAAEPVGARGPSALKARAFNTDLETRIQQITLSLLLVDASPPLSAIATRTIGITPFFGSGWGAGGYNPAPVPAPAGTLTTNQTETLQSMAKLVDARYAVSLAIPTRRLISALIGRHDIEDGLVDAVVAWESLFAGTDVGELSFRIAAAISWLLERNPEARLGLHREITRLYGTRSRVVHRGAAGRDVTPQRDRAVELGRAALLALLRDHPDLVADEDRGKKLIMRGESPPPP
jgi:Apea-like HEPN